MKIFKNKKDLIKEISGKKNIAFVPTMGSIHRGHLSLIKKAKKKTKNVLVSIFVNPKQFNSNFDFQKYPRNIYRDIDLLKKIKIKYLYLPVFKDIYSFRPKIIVFLDEFSKELCGKFRPLHFKGVINVVNRFLEIIKPRWIFLGAKDFQQLSIIKKHINKNKIKTKIISCTTIREKNGIAFSSRNLLLKKKDYFIAGKIYHLIKKNKKKLIKRKAFIKIIKKKILSFGANKIEYITVLDINNLIHGFKRKKKFRIFIAYYFNSIRLIDNI